MKAACPQCGSSEVRIHGTITELRFVRSWLGVGPLRLKASPVAAECSCSKCFYAFILREDSVMPAPRQDAYEQLKAAREVATAVKKEPEKRETTPSPRPAPDPRVRKR